MKRTVKLIPIYLLVFTISACNVKYNIQNLGEGMVNDINDAEWVVGKNLRNLPTVWKPSPSRENLWLKSLLPMPQGAIGGEAIKINNNFIAIGYIDFPNESGSFQRKAAIWDIIESKVYFPGFLVEGNARVYGLNDNNVVVGNGEKLNGRMAAVAWTYRPDIDNWLGYEIWDSPPETPFLPGPAAAFDLNNSCFFRNNSPDRGCHIVGADLKLSKVRNPKEMAVIFDKTFAINPNEITTQYGTNELGYRASQALGIGDQSQMTIGIEYIEPDKGKGVGFFRIGNRGKTKILPGVSNSSYERPNDINELPVEDSNFGIVGVSDDKAILWIFLTRKNEDPAVLPIILGETLSIDSDKESWSLAEATGINNDRHIVGNGKYLNRNRAFILIKNGR